MHSHVSRLKPKEKPPDAHGPANLGGASNGQPGGEVSESRPGPHARTKRGGGKDFFGNPPAEISDEKLRDGRMPALWAPAALGERKASGASIRAGHRSLTARVRPRERKPSGILKNLKKLSEAEKASHGRWNQ